MCVLGRRLLKDIHILNCTKNVTGELHKLFCPDNVCDPYYAAHNVSIVPGIKVTFLYSLEFTVSIISLYIHPNLNIFDFRV